jgi:hypothetical protein
MNYDNRTYARWSRDSVAGIATCYGLEGLGIKSQWGEIFRTYPDWLQGPPSLLYNRYRVFPGGKGGRGVMLTTHPLLVLRLRKSSAIPPLTLWVLLGLLRGSLYLYICSLMIIFIPQVLTNIQCIWMLPLHTEIQTVYYMMYLSTTDVVVELSNRMPSFTKSNRMNYQIECLQIECLHSSHRMPSTGKLRVLFPCNST